MLANSYTNYPFLCYLLQKWVCLSYVTPIGSLPEWVSHISSKRHNYQDEDRFLFSLLTISDFIYNLLLKEKMKKIVCLS